MKLLHLSDLHLGKRICGFSMIEDQRHILKQILDIIDHEQPEGIILAGDLYDKSIPSSEAVSLFDWFLSETAKRQKAIYAISGNHDSAERIAFGADLMKEKNVYFSPVYDGRISPIEVQDQYGSVAIWLMPFLKPATVRHGLKVEEEDETRKTGSYDEAIRTVVDHMCLNKEDRNILVAHQFVTGASRCESEEINVGGIDQVSADVFADFDYVALGHIHSPQKIGRPTVRYCGTPLKYSFSEAEQTKSVTMVVLLEKGNVKLEQIELKPLRDMRKLKGSYMELMDKRNYSESGRLDYVHITLTDEEDVPDGVKKLRTVYPNLMQLEYDNLRTRENQYIRADEEQEEKSEQELFEEFFELQNNQPMNEEQKKFIRELIEHLQ